MEDLRERIDQNKVLCKELIYGDEYLLLEHHCIGIYIGRSRGCNMFIVTHKTKDSSTDIEMFLTQTESWRRHVKLDGKLIVSYLEEFYNTTKKEITNLKDLTLVVTSRRHTKAITLRTQTLVEQPNSSLIITDTVKKVLKAIIANRDRTSTDYKIAKHTLSKLPTDLCEINDTGLHITVANTKEVQVFTLSRDKAVKALNKYARSTNDDKYIYPLWYYVLNNFEQTKIGRVIKRLVGKLYPDNDIETFVTTFSSFVIDCSSYKMEVVRGQDIAKWYHVSRYTKDAHGSLQNSCMRHANLGSEWAFYAQHPKCEMVIVTMGGLLHARALLWTLTTGEKYLDRIYYTNTIEQKMIVNWAAKEGIKLTHQSGSYAKTTMLVETNLENFDLANTKFPYTDTFKDISATLKYLIRVGDNMHHRVLSDEDKIYVNYNKLPMSRGGSTLDYLLQCWKNNDRGYQPFIVKDDEYNIIQESGYWKKVKAKDCEIDEKTQRVRLKKDRIAKAVKQFAVTTT